MKTANILYNYKKSYLLLTLPLFCQINIIIPLLLLLLLLKEREIWCVVFVIYKLIKAWLMNFHFKSAENVFINVETW
ncbi:hypothetical protein C0J52_00207 [Blattella germanica]|nr:hypothetical protein C0J52_00207 [Blattella germanica]